MSDFPRPLVSTDWLAAHLGQSGLAVLDASRHLPAAKRDAAEEFRAAHIPGAKFFDLAMLVDQQSEVPQAMPRPEQLVQQLQTLGVEPGDHIVVYDDSAVKTAARAWFLLVAHGYQNVSVLDGGLGKWRAEGRALESGAHATGTADPIDLHNAVRIRFKQDLIENLESAAEQVVDARSADRVFGQGIDPVHGGMNGRIPGSLNLPFGEVYEADGTFTNPARLRELFTRAGVDLDRPVVTSCGSGVTACVLLLALELAGKNDVALYDGSWVDWSSDPDTPKQQGPV